MEIILDRISHRYNSDWIFRDVSCEIKSGGAWAILGANGTGKSTLLQIISGYLLPAKGKIGFSEAGKPVPSPSVFRKLAICAPYLELIDEFTLEESVKFHQAFKPFVNGITTEEFIHLTSLEKNRSKPLKNFSSGMKQRVKLALAVLTDVPLVLLDEPTVNLDAKGIEWYRQLVETYRNKRTFVVSSNSQACDYAFCEQQLCIENFKNLNKPTDF